MIFFGFFLIFFGIFIALIISRYYSILQPFSIWHSEKSGKDCEIKKKMILLIAHPDDESMFFIPSLLSFIEYYNIDILCLSNGNYDDLGKLRELELQKVANFLKINNLKIINHAKLQDGMSEKWDISLIKSLIQEYYNEKPFEIILTFDENGVSDHPNHIAVSKGVK